MTPAYTAEKLPIRRKTLSNLLCNISSLNVYLKSLSMILSRSLKTILTVNVKGDVGLLEENVDAYDPFYITVRMSLL